MTRDLTGDASIRHEASHRLIRGRLGRFAVVALVLSAAIAMVNVTAHAADVWQPKTPPLSTPWTHLVGPNNALPDYPRPQLARTRWQNLNGLWGYTGRAAKSPSVAAPAD